MDAITLKPIGYVSNDIPEKKDDFWGGSISIIKLNEEFRGGLTGLESFSHAVILCFLDKACYKPEKHLIRRPRNRQDMPLLGIFSQRTKDHPNPIGLTTVEIVSVSDTEMTVKGLDAIDGTPVLDIKPYFPAFDRRESQTPEWVDILMENYFQRR